MFGKLDRFIRVALVLVGVMFLMTALSPIGIIGVLLIVAASTFPFHVRPRNET